MFAKVSIGLLAVAMSSATGYVWGTSAIKPAAAASCCAPGAVCCYLGSPCCDGADLPSYRLTTPAAKPAAKSCCSPGSPCCEPGAACCEPAAE